MEEDILLPADQAHTRKHKNVIAPHSSIPTDSLPDCSVVQSVPNRFIVTVNIVNV